MNIFKRDGLSRQLKDGHGIAEHLAHGCLPVIIIAGTGILLVLAHVGDFKVKIDQIFDLPAARAGPFGFVVQIIESLFGKEQQIIFPMFLPGIFDPGVAFIGFSAEDHPAAAHRKEFSGDFVERTGTFPGAGHTENHSSRAGVPDGPGIAFDIQNHFIKNTFLHLIPPVPDHAVWIETAAVSGGEPFFQRLSASSAAGSPA